MEDIANAATPLFALYGFAPAMRMRFFVIKAKNLLMVSKLELRIEVIQKREVFHKDKRLEI